MKLLRRISIIFIVIVAVILIAAAIIIGRVSKSGLPDYSQDIQLTGLSEPVSVYRDSLAIPHIYAKNEHDLYMAVGYLSAQDRMWQMDFIRRVTLGKLSEIFGDDYIETDLLLRSLRFSGKSEEMIDSSSAELIHALQAYADGVNAYINDNKGNYSFEFKLLGYDPEPWEIVHTLNLLGYMAWDLEAGWDEYVLEKIAAAVDSSLYLELLPDLAKQKTVVFNDSEDCRNLLSDNRLKHLRKIESMGADIFSGSNNWAVAGHKTTTGEPLLANDMHLSYMIPGIWMQMHQVIEGELNVTGLVIPGEPFIIDGHNDSIAWGMTNTYVDNLDYYEEDVLHEDTTMYYKFNGEWVAFEKIYENIRSKDGTVHKRHYFLNHRGPVVSDIKGVEDRVLTIHWVGDEYSNELRSVYMANRAKNLDDFEEAFETFKATSQNVAYADKKGNIAIYCCAGVPVRKRDKQYIVLPGNSDEYDWQRMVPFDSLPREINPERGYVSSANNRTADSTYRYHIGSWYDVPYRINRIREMLCEKDLFSIEDFKKMQNDHQSVFSALFIGKTLPALDTTDDWSVNEKAALDALKNWDYHLGKNSIEATVSEHWWFQFIKNTYSDEMGEELFKEYAGVFTLPRIALYQLLVSGESGWLDIMATENKENFADIARISFRATIAELEEKYGSDMEAWAWGKLHTLTLKHPMGEVDALNKIFKLNRGPYAVGGSFHTVSPYTFTLFETDSVYHGSSHRNIYDFSDWDNTISVIPTGMSGIPSSEHYCDQTEMYIQGIYHPDYFSKEAVKENKLYSMEFRP